MATNYCICEMFVRGIGRPVLCVLSDALQALLISTWGHSTTLEWPQLTLRRRDECRTMAESFEQMDSATLLRPIGALTRASGSMVWAGVAEGGGSHKGRSSGGAAPRKRNSDSFRSQCASLPTESDSMERS